MHHLIFLMPVLGLVVFWLLPPAVAVPIYAVILGASVVAYVAVVRAMRRPSLMGPRQLEHALAEVVALRTGGEAEIRVHGEIWRAVSADPLRVGDRVEVVAEEPGLVLRVTLLRGASRNRR